MLLKECEEARGGVVSSETSMHPMSSAEVTSSSQVISEHLVTFRLVGIGLILAKRYNSVVYRQRFLGQGKS